jgi:hypothetical protein
VLSAQVAELAAQWGAPPRGIGKSALHSANNESGSITSHPPSALRGAVLEVTHTVLAVFLTAFFLADLLRDEPSLFEPNNRWQNGRRVYWLICEREGDHAAEEYLRLNPKSPKAVIKAIRHAHREKAGGPALRQDRMGMYNLSRHEDIMTLRKAIDDLFGTPAEHMLQALQEPTHSAFLRTLQKAGPISKLFGGLGCAKNSTELVWLERIPIVEGTKFGRILRILH